MGRFLLFVALAACLGACGLVDDDREQENRRIYILIPDDALRAYCLAHFDGDGDGRISRYEARQVRRISCSGLGIRSMTGIEEFTSLIRLDCSANDIGWFDARPFPDLETLLIGGNAALSSLRTDNLRSLATLDCSGCSLANLSVGGNGALVWLDCSRNALVTLDVSSCAGEMERVAATGNPSLTTLYKGSSQRIAILSLDAQTRIDEL